MSDQTDVMVISAHPDDSEFGAAGTVAKWTRANKQVVYVVCTSGDKGTSDRSLAPEALARIREKEQTTAAELLAVQEVIFLRHPDQTLEDTPEFRKQIVRLLRRYRPETVVTSDPYRRYVWHRDHRVLGQVVLDAVFPFARDHLAYPDLLSEGFEPHKVREVWFWGTEDINYCSDITDTFHLKIAALRCHQSQIREFPDSDIEDRIRKRCTDMADGEKFELAEAFHRVELPE
ncbi:MAG: PIG-L family deacetylase [Desulfobacteraceae bacterium]|nr:MAG: PIG-L family deacetylase [Desulfobacteraceae bacterium]